VTKHTIELRRYPDGSSHHTSDSFEVVGKIRRVLKPQQIGNFNPVFCCYRGKARLVHSDAGDLSDPFRRDQSYLKTLFIEL
jgi:hypothetical protein